jgi:cytoskeletal protein RodZ
MLDKFAEELRKARLAKGISLQQMSAKTRIDIKFLEALDNGNFGFLPELYVKAFIKQYAKLVDLDEDEMVQRYEDAKAGKLEVEDDSKSLLEKKIEIEKPVEETKAEDSKKEETRTEHSPKKEPVDKHTNTATPPPPVNQKDKKKVFRVAAYTLGAIIAVTVIYIALYNKSSKIVVEETPYEKVLQETKDRYAIPEEEEETPKPSYTDSLVLQIANVDAVDSAWVMVIYDDKMKEDFLLYPKRAKVVKALDHFQLTLGNSGVIALKLDDEELKFEGLRGSVRHYKVTRDTIERLKSPPILKTD